MNEGHVGGHLLQVDVPAAATGAQGLADGLVIQPLLMPHQDGVPTAPNDTGVDWIIMPSSTAASAGKPMATSSGAAMAAGCQSPRPLR